MFYVMWLIMGILQSESVRFMRVGTFGINRQNGCVSVLMWITK